MTFSREQVERGRSYHRPRYLSELADFALGVAVLALLAFTGVGDALLPDWSWWAQALVYPAIVFALLTLVRLPISYWRDYVRERRWGLSTQSLGSWLADVAKAFAVSAVLATVLLFGLVALARWTDAWPLVAAPLAAVFVVFFTFVAPVVLEPIFNKFKPLEDQELAADLRGLSERVGVPVRDVLVADASRRTTKSNAYVSGFGATRRVVLYDTLLEQMNPAELRAVLAHELAHRKHGDVARLSAILVVAAVAARGAALVGVGRRSKRSPQDSARDARGRARDAGGVCGARGGRAPRRIPRRPVRAHRDPRSRRARGGVHGARRRERRRPRPSARRLLPQVHTPDRRGAAGLAPPDGAGRRIGGCMSELFGRSEPRVGDLSNHDAVQLEESLATVIGDAKGVTWYEPGREADLAVARLCLLRRARAGVGASPEAGDDAVRLVLAESDPESVVWLLSRAISYMDEQGFPDLVPGARPE